MLEDLLEYLRIPSVSTDPAHAADVHRCAEFTATLLRNAGLHGVRLIEGDGHPLVYGESARIPGRPTLLLYGHYDVQPPDPLDEWLSPPFEPTIRGDNLYARGAADDKGLLLILIKAVERLQHRLPVNIKFLIEGEEETDGHQLQAFLASRPAELDNIDAAVICDTEMFAPELPTICVGLRGIVYGELTVETGRQDLHSGVYGGAVPNAIEALAQLIAALKDPEGRIRIPGFCDAVLPPTPEERRAWARLPFDEAHYRDTEAQVHALHGEPEVGILERTWARPTMEVHGIRGGFTGEGTKTVIPCRATAKISFRLVPAQKPAEVIRQIRTALPPSARFEVLSAAEPSLTDPANRFVQAAARAMTGVFGRETVFTRSGGSIPVVGLFQRHLGIPSVLMGFGLPDDNLHAPNEKLYLPNFYRGIEAVVRYFEGLGAHGL